MITQETLDAVKKGVLTDDQLKEAIVHYKFLVEHLEPHGEIYSLTRNHARDILMSLEYFAEQRKHKMIPANWKDLNENGIPNIVQELMDKKGEQDNRIDLNAYGNGLIDLFYTLFPEMTTSSSKMTKE